MSIPVSLDRLAETLADFGAGYLLTASAQGRVKVVTVEPTVVEDALRVSSPGRGTLGNLAGNAQVTLAFPPSEPKGFTLLVDGVAEVLGEDVRVVPATAVLHRPAAHSDGPSAPGPVSRAESPTACGDDCHPVT